MSTVLAGSRWWLSLILIALVILLVAATVRSFAPARLWGSAAGAAAAIVGLTVMFVPGTAILGVIPTFESFGAFRELEVRGFTSIAEQQLPANPDQGIVYLVCLGVAVLVVVMDVLAFAARLPAFTGIPLVLLLLVPSLVRPHLSDAFFFALTAAAYIAILLAGSRRAGRRAGIAIGATALVAALITPLVAPSVQPQQGTGGTGGNFSAGLNPILTLGEDLRRDSPSPALTYTTSGDDGLYLRLTALDNFTGTAWGPTEIEPIPGNELDVIGAAPGLTDAIPRTELVTSVIVQNVQTRWLPAPYAPVSVDGVTGDWTWEPSALSIRSDRSSARGQVYQVASLSIAPAVEQLLAAGTSVDPGMERYLALPDDLPPVVATPAAAVVGSAATNYEKAVALQDFFRGGDFTYSEQTPVDEKYDGSGARVLEAFLRVRAGYCVHFASAMASMARTLGIPARVAVGFTPGTASSGDDGETEYAVSTYDFHAWPELYFSGIGWVRFEPTPGRGVVPEFAPLAVDDPATPDVDESVPLPQPTTVPTTSPDDALGAEPTEAPVDPGAATSSSGWPWWWVPLIALAALLVAPGILRITRRTRRIAARTPAAAWAEIRDTADDLGHRTSDARTPKQLVDDLGPALTPAGRAALDRLRAALEGAVFAENPTSVRRADVRTVLSAMRRRTSVGARLLARIAPYSLFSGLRERLLGRAD
jgi:transglutaminase-like putative cysteine protease